ncbi:MAG TPA: deoxyribonuclease IV [Candidatus Limnocylindrales bacterium]
MPPSIPRVGVHLPLGDGLFKAAKRADEIGARTVQVFVDNPTSWRRRAAPPKHLGEFRGRLSGLGIDPVAVHAAYLVNLAGPDVAYREASIRILASDMRAAVGYGATLVNVHTGSHRDTSVEAGIARIVDGIARVLDEAGDDAGSVRLALENASGGGHSLGVTIDELARIAELADAAGIPANRLGFCLDTAHAWGAGYAIDSPEGVEAWIGEFDDRIGLQRLFQVHLNDSRSDLGDRQDRHEHVGAGRIGQRGLGHLLRHPGLQSVPFISETPGMDVGYDAINIARSKALARGEALEPLPPEAFEVSSGGHRSAAPE